ncbi:Serine/threonine-protein kinase RIO1 [Caenorhabditis elegans]|uniref:Serine/threonine-protein kinase RIO1 n=1 Tax=Caenorhabditis elegans TaxID=6239 RepID=RIOK1_CAEEL|nr:Serine/threonine-protein kinase RIO1 [Caenorhabditis elegans]O44959.5 RecName: Full=Serine/threonine-protein kinase RIO1 [Caenorhabditis elegans]CCD67367.1 Serine/threonine-protein kinase RIO1 [Caenorhabditis elegans]|eukprot:NP_001021570.2 Serine/threonine-protein kinase RIO1 [Caenorhabditis elegans]
MEKVEHLNLNIQNILEDVDIDTASSSSDDEPEQAVVKQEKLEAGEQIEEQYDTDSDYDDDIVEFAEATGDFTKKLNAARLNTIGPNAARNRLTVDVERHADTSEDRKRKRVKDRADRATVEQVLDPRTRLVLFRLLQRGTLLNIDGCISTGKEANVYHATGTDNDLAIKIYKTSILTFKDRERYVTGEFRYRHGYCKSNPRKMVAVWAEKEMRNLARMHEVGLPVPKPHLLKGHVLVMDFLGKDGWPAPLLKNANLSQEDAEPMYVGLVRDMRRLYRECKLVHADLSEFNMLVHDGKLWIIDVSQSVEQDHPHALEFLRMDCNNVNKFFRELGVPVLSVRRLFEVIVDPLMSSKEMETIIEEERVLVNSEDDSLFMNAFIPHKLEHVLHFERDGKLAKEGVEANNPFQNIVSKIDLKGDGFGEEHDDSDDNDDEENGKKSRKKRAEPTEEEIQEKERKIAMHTRNREETAEERKERKAAVKEEKREQRKEKIPKHLKKRAHRQHMK